MKKVQEQVAKISLVHVGMGAAKSNETRYIGKVMSVNSGTWLLHFFQPV